MEAIGPVHAGLARSHCRAMHSGECTVATPSSPGDGTSVKLTRGNKFEGELRHGTLFHRSIHLRKETHRTYLAPAGVPVGLV